ncbi:hypothetical protein E1B28_000295 [Marasmius oreades]|uniref:Uncharacterized protein n=1 Tax=Marasmius oreades TaxID=181124 RepID=A0A9P7V105_9AGAR|nr:uncharacterized protein E1B28_000295 [Marasmius oreades]KAG7098334.1 hypothetical protein E1B28_000295 [Marasmius oreades]
MSDPQSIIHPTVLLTMDKGVNDSLALINLLKFDPTTTKTLALLAIALPVTCIVLWIRYPCITSAPLLNTARLAKETFDNWHFDGIIWRRRI